MLFLGAMRMLGKFIGLIGTRFVWIVRMEGYELVEFGNSISR